MKKRRPLDAACIADEIEEMLEKSCDKTEPYVDHPGFVVFYVERGGRKFHVTIKELTNGIT